ncbi:MAG: PP2C family protein-serine/threonine phosphatase, partial [Candidatus Binatia bacterium]
TLHQPARETGYTLRHTSLARLHHRESTHMQIHSAVKTDRGRVRQRNEDAFGLFPTLNLYVVADGLGGHVGGEIASALAVDVLGSALRESPDWQPSFPDPPFAMSAGGARLVAAVHQAHREVQARSEREPALAGMGTTLAALWLDGDGPVVVAYICHVGDSRVYRIRAGAITQLTADHSLASQLLREGTLHPQELPTFRYRHVLTQALGVSPQLQPDLRGEALEVGDVFLLCTDGIYREVPEAEMLAVVQAVGAELQAVCEMLVTLANERGGRDDSTILALRYVARW